MDAKERLMIALNLIPGINYINNGNKIRKCLTITKKTSIPSGAIKASKTIAKKEEKKISETISKKGGKNNNTDKKGEKKKDKKEDKKEDGEKPKGWPKNYSMHDNCNQALRQAKKDNNIPLSRQPEQTKPNFSKPKFGNDEKIQPGKVFVYKDIYGKDVEFRWDKKGHEFDDGTKIPPHFNGPNDMHYIYDDKKK